MERELSILVPVFDRPEAAAPLVESVRAYSARDWELVFLVSPNDGAELWEIECLEAADDEGRVTWRVLDRPCEPGDYARKINYGFRETTAPWIFQAADDLRFRPGWDVVAIETGEKYEVGVVGTNDLCNPRVIRGRHSTHSLVRRAYVDECGGSETPGEVLYEGYEHNFVDDELVGVAISRQCFRMSGAVVEHLHPNCRKGTPGATYARGHAGFDRDRQLFNARRRYWERAARHRR